MGSTTDYKNTFQVRGLALLGSVEAFIERPWSLERFRRMKADAECLRKWAHKKTGIPTKPAEMVLGKAYDCKKCHRRHPPGPCDNFAGFPLIGDPAINRCPTNGDLWDPTDPDDVA
jgi:hypothetical protein